jgi:putative ABC transport system permease protein
MLPLGYAIRNLFRDPARLAQAILGSGLVVLMVMVAVATNAGMTGVLASSGSRDNVWLIGAGSEENLLRSEIGERSAGIAEASVGGIATVAGERALSPEVHQLTYVVGRDGKRRRSLIRGVTSRSLLVHRRVAIRNGRFPGPGEIMVGRLAWRRLGLPRDELLVGRELTVENARMTISGVFAAPGTVMESELWMDINDLRSLSLREAVSCVAIRLADGGAFANVDLFTKQRLDLELSAIRESDYFARLAAFYAPVRAMTWVTALLIAAGAVFGGLNTLYAAFAPRIREIAALQAIGFRRRAILFSLVQESTLACLCGTIIASLVAAWWLDGMTVPFSIGTFSLRVTPTVALSGLCTGVGLGLIGAIPPGLRCLLPPLPDALRAPA